MNPPLRLEVSQPVLDFFEMEKIRHIERYTGGKFRSFELDITYPLAWGKEAVEARLASLCAQAEDAVRAGYSIIVISDRLVERERVAIPALLALSAIHQHLVAKGLRTSAGLVVETGSVREVHHFALLGGYGAEAVHPYLALETLLALRRKIEQRLEGEIRMHRLGAVASEQGKVMYLAHGARFHDETRAGAQTLRHQVLMDRRQCQERRDRHAFALHE